LGTGAWSQKKLQWWATGQRKKFDDIFSNLDTIHERDRQTDTAESKERAFSLRMASRRKNAHEKHLHM